ncbi:MAG: glycine cleavage system protein T, partial [Lentisphaeria bacterium]|nr:glycine cleavage system protein T [Lentisphaeria bacterium]
ASALPKYYHWGRFNLFGLDMLVSRTGYTGELGFELYFDAAHAVDVWRKLLACPGVKPAGLGARDTLRLEMGYPLYGDEMDESTTPVEAGFGALLKLDKSDRAFVGSKALRANHPKKRLRGIVLEGRRAAHTGTPLLLDGKPVGTITSGTFAPSLGCAVAMAYLDASAEIPEDAVFDVELHRAVVKAKLAPLPFWTHGTANPKV